MMSVFQKNLILVTLCLLFTGRSEFAFQTTNLSLVVIDENNKLITNFIARLKVKGKTFSEIQQIDEKPLIISNLEENEYLLEIESSGFKPYSQKIKIVSGKNNLKIVLEIQEIREKVEVETDVQEESVDKAFSGFLTRDQINALPDNPEEIEKELKRRYGNDTIIRVDGYGNRIPPKSKIASIKVSQSSFDAENHELGFNYIDITTKVAEEAWSGSVGFNFNNQYLNARNPFAGSRLEEKTRPIDLMLMGPIIQNKTAFDLWFIQNSETTGQNIIAVLPTGRFDSTVNSISNSILVETSIKHNLTKNQYIKTWYSFSDGVSENLGVGGFDLPERGYSSQFREHRFRLSLSGYVGNRFYNEFRSEYKTSKTKLSPNNSEPSIIVLDAFSRGSSNNASSSNAHSFFIADNFLFGYKSHAFKIGVLMEFEKKNRESSFNSNGTFTFSSLDNFVKNSPALFTQMSGNRKISVTQLQLGVFVQDDFRLKKNLNLSLGLRYEWQNNLKDFNNYSPRLGITWSPLKSGKATFRGGIGVFYQWLTSDTFAFILNRGVSQPTEIILTYPSFSNSELVSPNQSLNPSYWQKAEELPNPYIVHSSFGVDGQINNKWNYRINYVFQKGVHQFRARNINAPFEGKRLNENFGNINQIESSAFFRRNSLNIGVNGILRRGVSFGLSYSLQKRISDNDTIFEFPSDSYNLALDKSFAKNDQRHKIYGSLNWKIRKGLLASAIYSLNSPLPYTITTGIDNNNDTIFNDRPEEISRNSERGTWTKQLDLGFSWTFSFINFEGEKKGKSAIIYTETELTKDNETTAPNKRFSMKFFISARNVLNQTNFTQFIGVQTSPYFKQPILADNPRRVDLGLRFNF